MLSLHDMYLIFFYIYGQFYLIFLLIFNIKIHISEKKMGMWNLVLVALVCAVDWTLQAWNPGGDTFNSAVILSEEDLGMNVTS